ncbi:hypothetical protein WN51_06250 [Melipona quadrifasciata]|uniref:Uncharacterized protein n=1 Tax=Melipona quadrifasciata TaxID=166423 RepID=A0A0N0U3I2_9HYME|nr:hypothetical protein WN51_06250 [Melipona quadrifasciata]
MHRKKSSRRFLRDILESTDYKTVAEKRLNTIDWYIKYFSKFGMISASSVKLN